MARVQASRELDIPDLTDNNKWGSVQIGVFILCSLCLIMDGFDVQAMGYVAPAIIDDWHIARADLGPIFSAGLVGVLAGSLLFSMLADRIGRRPVLIGASLYFSAATILTARAGSLNQLLAIRFIAGVGLGGIMPNAVALVGEYTSRALRITMMMIVSNGFTAGAALGGFVSALLIPHYGWRSVFYFGGTVPVIIAVLMVFLLPESPEFRVLRGKLLPAKRREGLPILQLFSHGRATVTSLLWIVNFMNLLNLYFLSNWLPTVVKDSGYTNSAGVLVGTTLQVGGTIGALGLGWLIGRLGFVSILTACFTLAGISIALIGDRALPLTLLFVAVFIAGLCIVGGQSAVNALAGTYYPTELRSTGIGSGLGVGRIGAIVGPVLGGEAMRYHWPTQRLFLAAAVPALISAVVMLSLHWAMEPQAKVR
ncbi:MAG: MFS transporter [Bryobacteraceae bacterium]